MKYLLLPLFILQFGFCGTLPAFAAEITKELLKEQELKESLFISPYSMQMTLHMAMEGASGKTFGEMRHVLGPLPRAEQNSTFQSYQAVAIDSSYTPLASFTNALKSQFHTDLLSVNFLENREQAIFSLNKWVSDATDGLIQNLIQPTDIDSYTRMVLLNAALFRGSWQLPFRKEKSETGLFYLTAENKSTVTMMQQKAFFQYGQNDDAIYLQLPFKRVEGETEYLCTAVLPKDEKATARIAENPLLALFQGGLKQEFVELTFPKVVLDARIDLKPALKALGIRDAFTPKANFARISTARDLYIDKVFQKTHLKIDEAGVEAAAATAASFSLLSMREPEERKVVRFDRPFFLFISERGATEPLFVGFIKKP